MLKNIKHIVIVGPTASGKTALSLRVAQLYNAEIIAADSRTVYKGMNVGTAKPSPAEQKLVPHHCLDIALPDNHITVAEFAQHAKKAQKTINSRGFIDITVGGSGLFVDGFTRQYIFTPHNTKLAEEYKNMSVEELQQIIVKNNLLMPENSKNKRYLLNTISRGNAPLKQKGPLKDTLFIGIDPSKEDLIEAVTMRAQQMIQNNVEQEVKNLYKTYGADCKALNGGIYKTFKPYIDGKVSLQEAIDATIQSDINLSKRQRTWFKRHKDITWFNDGVQAYNWLASQ
mgnify:FL=1